jgi:hypothetical protein
MENTADALVLLNCTTRRISIPKKLKNMIGRCDNGPSNDNDTTNTKASVLLKKGKIDLACYSFYRGLLYAERFRIHKIRHAIKQNHKRMK